MIKKEPGTTRYIRLIGLAQKRLEKMGQNTIGVSTTVELSNLKPDEQKLFLKTVDNKQATPLLSQVKRVKLPSQKSGLKWDVTMH